MLTGLHHIGYVVPDLDQAIAFYRDTLGLSLTLRADATDSFGIHVAVFRLGDGSSGIELIQPVVDGTPFAAYLQHNPAGGVHHIAYATDKPLTDIVDQVKGCGLSLSPSTPDGPIDSPASWRIMNIDGAKTNGLLTQFGEY